MDARQVKNWLNCATDDMLHRLTIELSHETAETLRRQLDWRLSQR